MVSLAPPNAWTLDLLLLFRIADRFVIAFAPLNETNRGNDFDEFSNNAGWRAKRETFRRTKTLTLRTYNDFRFFPFSASTVFPLRPERNLWGVEVQFAVPI